MPDKITVICVRSLSYTGTTWINAVLGCHEKALALGPADRIWDIANGRQPGPACLVHGAECDFWEDFLASYTPEKNLFVELAAYSGKTHFVTNNLLPDGAATQLQHPDIETKYIQVVRDGRALAESFSRKFPDKAFVQAITEFLQPSFHHFLFDEGDPDLLCLRYEDVVADQTGFLEKAGRYVGLDYDEKSLRYWEWPLHLISGNQGMIATIRLGQGLPIADFNGHEFYREQFEKMKNGEHVFKDDRVKSLSRFDRFVFDALAGEDNERFGYERDRFTTSEIREFLPLVRQAHEVGKIPESFMQAFDLSL